MYNPKTAALSKAVNSKKRPSTVPAWPVTRSHTAAPSDTTIIKILKRNNAARSDMVRCFPLPPAGQTSARQTLYSKKRNYGLEAGVARLKNIAGGASSASVAQAGLSPLSAKIRLPNHGSLATYCGRLNRVANRWGCPKLILAPMGCRPAIQAKAYPTSERFCGISFSLSKRAELALTLRPTMHSLCVLCAARIF